MLCLESLTFCNGGCKHPQKLRLVVLRGVYLVFLKLGENEVRMSMTDLLWRNRTAERLAVIFFDCFVWFFNMLKSPCVSVSLGILAY